MRYLWSGIRRGPVKNLWESMDNLLRKTTEGEEPFLP